MYMNKNLINLICLCYVVELLNIFCVVKESIFGILVVLSIRVKIMSVDKIMFCLNELYWKIKFLDLYCKVGVLMVIKEEICFLNCLFGISFDVVKNKECIVIFLLWLCLIIRVGWLICFIFFVSFLLVLCLLSFEFLLVYLNGLNLSGFVIMNCSFCWKIELSCYYCCLCIFFVLVLVLWIVMIFILF